VTRITCDVLTCCVLALAVASCGARADGPPEIVVDRTPCAHCGMLVSEPAFAAAYRRDGADARIFDDIRCLLNDMKDEANPKGLRFWFHDAASGVWITSEEAVFVKSARFRTPMSGNMVGYAGRSAGERAASENDGVVIGNVDELLKQRQR
jgi:copper chaperone NosL